MGLLLIDEQFLPQAMALLDMAQREIAISTFKLEITDKPRGRPLRAFFMKLVEKCKAGIKVNILFNCHDDRRATPRTNLPASAFLKKAGADVRYLKDNRCCHAKALIIDKEQALIGSHNLSVMSCASNFEVSYLTPDLEIVKRLSDVFAHSFNAAKKA
jgi:phosphatidylserine/phosphatidylglycerophosphate/cardiolipin synthase-like enzyme